jgi:hypothetical protein
MEMAIKKQIRTVSITVPIIFSILLVVGFTSIGHSFNDAFAATASTSIHTTKFWSLNVPITKSEGSTFVIDGKFRDTTTGQFLASKTITFTSSPPMAIPNAVTDSNGFYSVTGLVAPAAGSYNIQAHFAGDSQFSSSNSVTKTMKVTTTITLIAPQPPIGLTATGSSSQIDLSWTAPLDDGGSPITGYAIERSADSGSTWSGLVSNTGSTATTYSDTGLASGTTFTYRVSAVNIIGASSPSNTASASTPLPTSKGFLVNIFVPSPTSVMTGIVNTHLTQNDFESSYRTENMILYPKLNKSLYTSSVPMTVNQIAVAKQFGLQYVCYDNEQFNGGLSTPASELAQPAYYTNTVGKMVKDAGFKYNIQPTWEALQQEYKGVDWKQVDLLTMQLQRFPLGITPEQNFKDLAIAVSTLARSQNPNITILAQVNLAFDTSPNDQAAIDFVNSLRDHIDGVSVVVNPGDPEAPVAPFLTALGR